MKIIGYLLMMVITVYLQIMYKWEEGIWLLSAQIVLPFLCMWTAYISARKIEFQVELIKDVVEREEEIPMKISLKNNGIFSAKMEINLCCQYLSNGKKETFKKIDVLEAKEKKEHNLEISAEYCGKLLLTASGVRVFDCFGFLSFLKRQKIECELVVMPKPYPMSLIVSNRTKWFPIDGESYAQDRAGEDHAEIYEVREYRAGDRMQKVHWKLSAKEEELFIKEFSYPLGAAVILLLEAGNKKEEMEHFLEVIVSISIALLEQNCSHYIAWKKKEGTSLQRVWVHDEESFHGFLLELLTFQKNELEGSMEERYRHDYKSDSYATLMKIRTDLTMQVNQEELELNDIGVRQFFETVEIIV